MARGIVGCLLLVVSVLSISTAQNNLTFSGTVFAAPNSSLQNTVVIACLLVNDECSDTRSKFQQINLTAASAKFQIPKLENTNYVLLAWRDLDKNGEVNAGDQLAVYSQSGKPKLLKPPAANLELRLTTFTGDIDALLAQVSPPVAQTPKPTPVSLTLAGRVLPQAGSDVQNVAVAACVFVADACDAKRTKAAFLDTNGNFSLADLEKTAYGLFAWRDTDGSNSITGADEFGVFMPSGRVSLATPPMSGIVLQMQPAGQTDYDAMRDLFTPAANVPSPAASTSSTTLLSFIFPADWRNTGGGDYEADWNGQGVLFDPDSPGKLYTTIYPTEAKSGNLLTQTRSIWQRQTKGSLDFDGKVNGVFVRRLPSGLNIGVTTGSAGNFDYTDGTKTWVYSVFFLVEVGNQVVPIFFKLERPVVRSYTSKVYEGRPLILEFMRQVKPAKPVSVAPLYSEKDFLGKWKIASNLYSSTDYYNINSGAYSSTRWTASAFSSKLSFQTGGVGTYFAELIIVTNGATNIQRENEKSKWRIVGDLLIIERPASKRVSTYQLYGIATDEKNQPIILSSYLVNGKPNDLDSTPEDIWVTDK